MAEHWFLAVTALLLAAGWLFFPRAPPPRPPLTPLEQATRKSLQSRLSKTRERMAELVRVNEELAAEMARLGRLKDKAQLEVEELKDKQLAERDELIQRLRRCVCSMGPALIAEMEENERG